MAAATTGRAYLRHTVSWPDLPAFAKAFGGPTPDSPAKPWRSRDPAIHRSATRGLWKMGPRGKPGGDDWWHSGKEKSRLAAGPSLLSLGSSVRTNGRPCPVGQVSGPDDSGLAVAVRASGRRPAADRASDSDSAGPDSGWGWTSGSPWLNVVPDNQAGGNWLQGNLEVSGLFRGGRLSRLWRREPRGLNLPMYKPLTPTPRCCRTGFPLLEKPKLEKSQDATCRLPGPSPRLSILGNGSAWTISPSN